MLPCAFVDRAEKLSLSWNLTFHRCFGVLQAAQLEARTYSGTSSLGALYEPSSSYNPTPSSRPLSSNAEDEN